MKSISFFALESCYFGEVDENIVDIFVSDLAASGVCNKTDDSAETVIDRCYCAIGLGACIEEDIDELIADWLNLFGAVRNFAEVINEFA